MKYTVQQLEEKINKLREDYKTALPADRKLLKIRADLYKKQKEIIESKQGFI